MAGTSIGGGSHSRFKHEIGDRMNLPHRYGSQTRRTDRPQFVLRVVEQGAANPDSDRLPKTVVRTLETVMGICDFRFAICD